MQRTKRKQLKFYLDQKQYEKLTALAKEKDLTLASMAKTLTLEGMGEQTEVHSNKIEQLEKRINQLASEVGRLGKDVADINRTIQRSRIG